MTPLEMKYNFHLKFNSLFEFSAPAYDDRQISWLLTEAQWREFIARYNPMMDKYHEGFEGSEMRRRELQQLVRQADIFVGEVNGGSYTTNTTGSLTYVGDTTSGSNIITNLDTIHSLLPGAPISGAGIPNDTIITDIVNDNSVVISNSANGTNIGVSFQSGLGLSINQVGKHPDGVFIDVPRGFLFAIEESAITNVYPNEEILVKPVTHDVYRANIRNPYKKPYDRLVWRMDFSSAGVDSSYESSLVLQRVELIAEPNAPLTDFRVRYLQLPPDIVVNELSPENERHCILNETIHRSVVDEAVKIARASVDPEKYELATAEKQSGS